MFLKFGARNFTSFREGLEISLELGAKCPTSISKGKFVSNLLCLKGANGSGKSNALRILSFLKEFCCDSFNTKPDEEIFIDSFFMNDDPIDIFCDFIFGDTQYHYELSLTRKGVIAEEIYRKINRLSMVLRREGNELAKCISEFDEIRRMRLRNNASLISTANQYEIESMAPIYKFFASIISNMSWYGRAGFPLDYKMISKYYKTNPQMFKAAIEAIKEFDLGIVDIKIRELTDEKGVKYNFPMFRHNPKNVQNEWLTYYSQSLGTKTLYVSYPYYMYTLWSGGVLVMDEFDTDFHPHILPEIVKIFDNENINSKNAQMIFSTHNTDIIDFMGKYRTVLINKDFSESYGYRLDEIPGDIIRNDRPIAPVYKSGKIGGVPRL